MKLPTHPPPEAGESAWGYVLRLADLNGLSGVRLLRLALAGGLEDARLAHLLDAPGIREAPLQALSGLSAEDLVRGHLERRLLAPVQASRARYCPHCLREQGWWRGCWEQALYVYCPRHGVLLVDVCEGCGRPVPVKRGHLGRCPCGQRFGRGLSGQRVEDERFGRFLEWLAEGMEAEAPTAVPSGLPVLLGRLPLQELHALLLFLGRHAGGTSSARRWAFGIAESVVGLQAAFGVLDDWPAGLERRLAAIVDRQWRGQGLGGPLQRFYGGVYRQFGDIRFQFLHQAMEAALRSHWDKLYADQQAHCKGRPTGMPEQGVLWFEETLVTRFQAARWLGLTPHVLLALHRAGYLPGMPVLVTIGQRIPVRVLRVIEERVAQGASPRISGEHYRALMTVMKSLPESEATGLIARMLEGRQTYVLAESTGKTPIASQVYLSG